MRAYHAFIQAGVVAQGLLQYLAVVAPKLIWDSFGSWLRTIRPGIPPSEFVVANSLRQTLPDFLFGCSKNGSKLRPNTEIRAPSPICQIRAHADSGRCRPGVPT